ncbi:Calcium-independent phospholipase A2-gamma [Lachnellula suecica]|uniref:Calcium-independent phospholipase A2-gamma n=1 Tax=Lachnellula suecica TaxID=602035 RepID=A0A8T9CKE6_9HELO|nr:Calcium-independent phospholipase A2-gamma [Lachnellula suecica]
MEIDSISHGIRALSLDGGGVKGLASLLILQRIFRTLQMIEKLPEMPKPCDYFDLIGGTSTGGHISESVFKDNPSSYGRFFNLAMRKPFFRAENLEKAIKDLLIARGIDPEALFKESEESKCKVFVCSTRNIKPAIHNVLIRSYTTWIPTEENYDCHIWEAARATSAAPLFFEPLKLKSCGATFGDGALGLNNPISEVINEADRLFPNADFKCILSIGTGLTDVKGLDTSQLSGGDVIRTCVDLSMNANRQAQAFARGKRGRDMLNNKTYFRFDVDRNIENISLEEWKKMDEIRGLTDAYLGRPEKENELRDCATSLRNGTLSPSSNPETSPAKPTLSSTLPVYSTPNFSGRKAELTKIFTIFQRSEDLHKRVALFGLGGIGKSQIAYEYAKRHMKDRSTFWVRANTLENMEAGYLAIATLLQLEISPYRDNVFLLVKGYLESDQAPPWLMVLDELDDKETMFAQDSNGVEIIDYIPRSQNGHVLITTRDSRIVGLRDGLGVPAQNGIRVGPMPFREALALFRRCMRQELSEEATPRQYRVLLDMLGGLPLALVQAASYMREEEASVEEFTALYRDIEKHESLFHESAINTDREQRSVLFTWEISYKRIAGPTYPHSKSQAAMLLDLLGFLDAQATSTRSFSEIEHDMEGTDLFDICRGFEEALPPQTSPPSLLANINESRLKSSKSAGSIQWYMAGFTAAFVEKSDANTSHGWWWSC